MGIGTALDIVGFVGTVIAGYTGYKRDKAKEDDSAVRRMISVEIGKARTNLTNVLTTVSDNNDKKGSGSVKRLIDELDMFNNELKTSEVGHKYPFFSPQKSIDGKSIAKVIEFDKSIIDKMSAVTDSTSKIETNLIDGETMDLNNELTKIRQYITNTRNEYKNRIDYIKQVKD